MIDGMRGVCYDEEDAIRIGSLTSFSHIIKDLIIMSAIELLGAGRVYFDDEIRKLMSGHFCRCTGYENIFRAVKKQYFGD